MSGWGWDGEVGPVVRAAGHHDDPVGVDAEAVDDLAADHLGEHHHHVGAAQGAWQGPAQEGPFGWAEPVGVVEGLQVVHGYDRGPGGVGWSASSEVVDGIEALDAVCEPGGLGCNAQRPVGAVERADHGLERSAQFRVGLGHAREDEEHRLDVSGPVAGEGRQGADHVLLGAAHATGHQVQQVEGDAGGGAHVASTRW